MLNHFFSLEMGYPWTFALEFKLLPTKKPSHVIYHWIRNFKYIINIKLSFVKNDLANFDYALTLKKSLDTSLLLYAKTRKYPAYVSKQNSSFEKKQVILLMIPNSREWHYLAVKNPPALLRGITSKNNAALVISFSYVHAGYIMDLNRFKCAVEIMHLVNLRSVIWTLRIVILKIAVIT